jgi:hypothetical protein
MRNPAMPQVCADISTPVFSDFALPDRGAPRYAGAGEKTESSGGKQWTPIG